MNTPHRYAASWLAAVPTVTLSLLALVPVSGDTSLSAQAARRGQRVAPAHQIPGDTGGGHNRHAQMSKSVSQVGFCALGGANADVWGHEGFAYVGSEGSGSNSGVAVIDLSNPARPQLTGRVAAIPNTTTEDVMVARVETPFFQGNLLATGIQATSENSTGARGIDLWDVTNPRQPRHLAFWSSDRARAGEARGVHELYLFRRGDRAFVAAMVPESEERGGKGDFRLVDVTDPENPVQAAEWGAFKDGNMHEGGFPWGHSVTVNAAGTTAVLSFWDAGLAFLDISDASAPKLVRRMTKPSGPAGNTHSAVYSDDESQLFVTDENLQALPGRYPWGGLRTWDVTNPDAPVRLSEFRTKNSKSRSKSGLYSVHNTIVRGNTAYLSWYSDGVRIVDFSKPRAPREIGWFVPLRSLVWGVHVDNGYILASDIYSGLYILKLK